MNTFGIAEVSDESERPVLVNDRPLTESELDVVNGGFLVLYYAALGAGIGYAAAQVHNNW